MDILIEYAKSVGAKDSLIESFKKCGDTPLVIAIAHNDSENLVKKLISSGEDINEQCGEDLTCALHQAVIHRKPEIVRILIENGADLSLETNTGYSVLHFAFTKNMCVEIIRILLDAGAKPNKLFMCNFETIMLELICKDKKIAQLLLNNVSDKELKQKWNCVNN
jgi:ankyrin repeat protein